MNISTLQYNSEIDELFKIYKFKNSSDKIHGFLVKSTAPINVDEPREDDIPQELESYCDNEDLHSIAKDQIKEIAKILTDAQTPEIVLRILGGGKTVPTTFSTPNKLVLD